jgi:hypothetical protein
MRGVLRRDVDEPFLAYLEAVVFDVEATRQAIAEEHSRRTNESTVLIAQAQRALADAEAAVARVERDYLAGNLKPERYERLTAVAEAERAGAEAEADQLRARAAEVDAEAAAFDANAEAAERMAALREAVAGEVAGADGLHAVRAALARVFEKVVLVRDGDELLLVPQVRAFDEIEAWTGLADGRTAVKPKPQTLALPGKQLAREPS